MDRAYQFAAWLTSQPGVLTTGKSEDAAPMAEAVGKFVESNPAFDFQSMALRTKSDKFFGELVPQADVSYVLRNCIDWLNKLDAIKKALFYGKNYIPIFEPDGPSCAKSADSWMINYGDNIELEPFGKAQAIDLIHGLLGKATEAGEGLEELLRVMHGAPVDAVNVREETFDGQWYDAVVCNAIGSTFYEGQRDIIAKLRRRFPEKFDTDQAINRDHAAERKVLDAGTPRKTALFGAEAAVKHIQSKAEYRELHREEATFEGREVVAEPGEDLRTLTHDELVRRANPRKD